MGVKGLIRVFLCSIFLYVNYTLPTIFFNKGPIVEKLALESFCGISIQYQYNINQVSNENKEKYQFGDNELIQY